MKHVALLGVMGMAGAVMMPTSALAAQAMRAPFGYTADGKQVEVVTLSSRRRFGQRDGSGADDSRRRYDRGRCACDPDR